MLPTAIKPNHIFCQICERRLAIPEQWQTGLCADHAHPDPLPPLADQPDWALWLSQIDDELAAFDTMPMGAISRPMNRRA